MTNLLSPFVRTVSREVQPVTTVGNDLRTIVFKAPYACTVSAVKYIPVSTQAGADTNSRTLNLYNRTTGAGTVLVATLALVNAVDLTDNVEKTITVSATAANLELALGDVLEWESLHVGTGIADPGGLVSVSYARAD